MTLADDIGPYKGLIHSTAARYAPILDEDYEDVVQILALKVWQARCSFDQSRTTLPERNYVFSCVTNRVKDLLKAQSRLNHSRGGARIFIEDVDEDQMPWFEAKYLLCSEDDALADVEDQLPPLPSTLTVTERQVVILLVLEYNQTEVQRMLGISRSRLRSVQGSVREKMADWRPSPAKESNHEDARTPVAA